MGKWVVCSRHPSNEFFFQFPNCLPFSTEEDFAACVSWALRHEPEELTPELRWACLLVGDPEGVDAHVLGRSRWEKGWIRFVVGPDSSLPQVLRAFPVMPGVLDAELLLTAPRDQSMTPERWRRKPSSAGMLREFRRAMSSCHHVQ